MTLLCNLLDWCKNFLFYSLVYVDDPQTNIVIFLTSDLNLIRKGLRNYLSHHSIIKLINYGFDNNAIHLFMDYFKNRMQVTKIGDILSQGCDLVNGVPQGSVLGPLLFLIYINDMGLCNELDIELFADDTTITMSNERINNLISSFKIKIEEILEWVNYNQLIINWSKTKAMFITRKHDDLPSVICIRNQSISIEEVKVFKLLGVHIDNKLSFHEHIKTIKRVVNKKLYSIKNIFYLAFDVKVQFFKTFILPHFDYCSALHVYFTKTQMESLEKFHKVCLFRLLGIKLFGMDSNEQLEVLAKYNLVPYKMRIFQRFNSLFHKIVNNNILHNFYENLVFKDKLSLRDRDPLEEPNLRTNDDRKSLSYVLPKYVNKVIRHIFNFPWKLFDQVINQNFATYFKLFEDNFYNNN